MVRDKQVDFLRPLIRERLITTKNIDYYLSSNNLNMDKMEPLELMLKYFPKDEFSSKEHVHIIVSCMQQEFLKISNKYYLDQ
ncbi:hypothetical protein RhiirA5_366367, partial [Rhizophagus irregularis]